MKSKYKYRILSSLALVLCFFSSCKQNEANTPDLDKIFANFSFTSENDFIAPSEVSFENSSLITEGAGTPEYSWRFGDGSTGSNLENPVHTFSSPGEYNVTLTVTIPDVETQEVTLPVTIKDPFVSIFSEVFDGHNPNAEKGADLPNTWVLIDNDGGTPFDTTLYTAAWKIITSDKMESDVAVATSYYTNTPVPDADDWMISPAVQLTDTVKYTLLWNAMSLTESGNWPDSYEVYISTTTQNIEGCTDPINGKLIKAVNNESWAINATDKVGQGVQSYEIEISEFAGDTIHLGFRLMTPAPGGSELAIDSVIVRKYLN